MAHSYSNKAFDPRYIASIKNNQIKLTISQVKTDHIDGKFIVYKPAIKHVVYLLCTVWDEVERFNQTHYNIHSLRYKLLEPLLRDLYDDSIDLRHEINRASQAILKAYKKVK